MLHRHLAQFYRNQRRGCFRAPHAMARALARGLLKYPAEGKSPRGGAWNGQAAKNTSRAPEDCGRFVVVLAIGGIPRANDRFAAAAARSRTAADDSPRRH